MTVRLLSRKQAIEQNEKLFFTGVPCKNNHIANRIVSTYKCIECKRQWEIEWRKKNPERDKKIRMKEVRKNADSYRKRSNQYYKRKGKTYMYQLRRTYRKQNAARVLETCNKRRAQKTSATPPWYEKEKCIALYQEAISKTKSTGVMHHVDHVIPLQGEGVSGLHCFSNLEVITATENLKKSNFYN